MSQGDLLIVQRFLIRIKSDDNRHVTYRFKIFKLQFNPNEEAERVEVKSLGGDALFLGDNQSMAVLASDFPGCRPNCIYFTDHYLMVAHPPPVYGRCDLGIFNVDDGSFQGLCNLDCSQKHLVPAIWILPTPSLH
ncbi:unnamed protein product [Ilex paraguariensis]|uniref:KIB1-4 beta-propeller domain-containing protein n=1 Tax=Ilex paraguariensis TaxID=185542 RepID=A0ABC8UYQ9_9AQUA